MIPTRPILLSAIFILATGSILSARTWKEAGSDRSFDGEFVKIDGENVVIRRSNGSIISVPLAKFSEDDQAFVKEQAAPSAAPEGSTGDEVVLSGVHLCCGKCETGVNNALSGIEGLEVGVDRGAKTVTLSGSRIAEGLEALASKGYYGESSSKDFKIAESTASDQKADSVEVEGVHLCCGSCVKAVDKAMAKVDGFSSHNAAKDSSTFTVEGDKITPADVLAALRAEGLSGIVK